MENNENNEFQEMSVPENEPAPQPDQQEDTTYQNQPDRTVEIPNYGNYNVQPSDPEPPKKKKWWIPVVSCCAVLVIVFAVLVGTHVICLRHDWQPATCTEPEICSKCNRTREEPLGHDWLDATCTEPKTCSRCDETRGRALGHVWENATCTEPKTCSRCGETSGKALGHAWEDANCTEPKTCSRCGETNGTALGHDWKAATCTEPETCSRCGQTEGKALGHTPGETKTEDIEMVTASYWLVQRCSVCGEVLERDFRVFSSLHQDGKFLFTPAEFAKRLELACGLIAGCEFTTGIHSINSDQAACVVWDSGQMVAAISFIGNGGSISELQTDSAIINGLLGYCYTDDSLIISEILIGLVITCNTSLEFDDAKNVVSNILDADGMYEFNGVSYGVSLYNGHFIIMVAVT